MAKFKEVMTPIDGKHSYCSQYKGASVGRVIHYVTVICGLHIGERVQVGENKITYPTFDNLFATYNWDKGYPNITFIDDKWNTERNSLMLGEKHTAKTFGCGRKECSSSTGIDDSATFGTGDLDDNGFWEFPCKECEKTWLEHESFRKSVERVRTQIEYKEKLLKQFSGMDSLINGNFFSTIVQKCQYAHPSKGDEHRITECMHDNNLTKDCLIEQCPLLKGEL